MKVTVMYWNNQEEHFENVVGYKVTKGRLILDIDHGECAFETHIMLSNVIKFGVRKR